MKKFLVQVILTVLLMVAATAQEQDTPLATSDCGTDGCETETNIHEGEWFELSARKQSGCIVVKNAKVRAERQLILGECGDIKNAWRFNNGLFHSRLDDRMCMQAGKQPGPMGGRKIRLFPCDTSKELQEFFHYDLTGHIKLKSNENLCIEFQGHNANINEDNIVLKKCEDAVDGWTKVFESGI